MVLMLCDRFHVLPSALLAEDADLFRLLNIAAAGAQKEVTDALE